MAFGIMTLSNEKRLHHELSLDTATDLENSLHFDSCSVTSQSLEDDNSLEGSKLHCAQLERAHKQWL